MPESAFEASSSPVSDPVRIIRAVGDRAVLVGLPSLADVLDLQAHLQRHPLAGQLDVLAAAETVLITGVSASAARGFADALRQLQVLPAAPANAALVRIDTVYDGEDLADVAAHTGLSSEGVIAAHTGQDWTAAFGGFAPGFLYLTGASAVLTVPRRSSPRSSVPTGSVAVAGDYSAVYPRASPGGWQLLGRTDALLWDLKRSQPALIRPGDRVRFRAVREQVAAAGVLVPETAVAVGTPAAAATPDVAATAAPTPATGIRVLSPGAQTTVQDLGRPGYADQGVTASGALDRGALRRANRVVGNPATAAVLENALGGLSLTALADQVLAVTGAVLPLTVTDAAGRHRELPMDSAVSLFAGQTLSLGAPRSGARSYLAFRGGIDVDPVLGSRSTDTLSGIGPAPLTSGTVLRMLPPAPGSAVHHPETPPPAPAEVTVLRFVPGPRADWFEPASVDRFGDAEWTVTHQSNRIGLRLAGEPLARSRPGELASEGTARGAIQVPPSGLPVLFLADHPVTGGYPVIGVVLAEDLDLAAQLPTGARIRFTPVPAEPLPADPVPASP
ncbi:5-oxoprolinase/urea amidolyase family protein [Cryobacterium sandaracinum]|uniref:5-oxoprolinase/urea amidolyase family protein n=1 Tax=Cryobacterium sandaracinum TaxID=1259247 RepID=A0ABY2JCY2_9MICO|nr:5-oxoprolinase/urea amidolyase family protein [Cryobacterium sandaracinum]TFD02959.1 5-oxoprolinase/urea amidolyase family protein [Cryobacterium sandaracinum]